MNDVNEFDVSKIRDIKMQINHLKNKYEFAYKDQQRNEITSNIDSTITRFLPFLSIFVAVSQCGNMSAATCEAIANGIAKVGFPTFAAITAPKTACAVAVISFYYRSCNCFLTIAKKCLTIDLWAISLHFS